MNSKFFDKLFGRFKTFHTSQLARNVASGSIVSAATAVLMAVSYPFYISKLGYQTYGIWIALSVIISMSQLGNLGMSQALVKRVAENYQSDQHAEVAKFYTTAIVTLGSMALLLFVVLSSARSPILHLLGLNDADAQRYSHLATGVFALSVSTFVVEVITAILSGIGRIDLYNYSQLATQSTAVLLSAGLILSGYGLEGLLIGQITGYAVGLLIAMTVVRRNLPVWPLRARYFSTVHLRILIGQGSLLLGSWSLSLLFHPTIKVLLAQSGHFGDLPIYEIAVNLSMRVRNLFESGQRALMPETSRLAGAARSNITAIRKLITTATKGLFVSATPVYLVLFIAAEAITKLWLRTAYTPFVPVALRFFLVGTFFSLLGTPAYYALIGLGRAQSVLLANALQFISCMIGAVLALLVFRTNTQSDVSHVLAAADVALLVSTGVLLVCVKRTLEEKPQRAVPVLTTAGA